MLKKLTIYFLTAFFVSFFLMPHAYALKQKVKGEYASSKSPYWNVGKYDKTLSIACQRREFLQRKNNRWSIGYYGRDGKGITGIASLGFNLIDKKNLARPGYTYHFFNQGYSNCKVFQAQIPRNLR